MAIKMSQYSATDRYRYVGNVFAELSESSEAEKKHAVPDSHVLCYMAKGITTKWKQVVGM